MDYPCMSDLQVWAGPVDSKQRRPAGHGWFALAGLVLMLQLVGRERVRLLF